MRVREILAVKGTVLYTVAPEQTLDEAVATMTEQDVGSLVCFKGGRMVGMLTFREVLKAVQQDGANWQASRIADIMVGDPQYGHPMMDVDELRRFMVVEHMRYLPIMEGDTLLGVISFHDVARATIEAQGFENRRLKEYIRDWPESESEARRPD